jgi:hypothetical protein
LFALQQGLPALHIRITGIPKTRTNEYFSGLGLYLLNPTVVNLIGPTDFHWVSENSEIGRPQVIFLTLRLSYLPRSGITESNVLRLKSTLLNLDFTLQRPLRAIVSSDQRAILDVSATKGPTTGGTSVIVTLRYVLRHFDV